LKNISKNLEIEVLLAGSKQFSMAEKAKDGDTVSIMIEGKSFERVLKVSNEPKGTIALMPTFDLGYDGQALMAQYRFNQVTLKGVSL